jgi:ribosomal protein L12E/L44/L45/RPP1/RPP2
MEIVLRSFMPNTSSASPAKAREAQVRSAGVDGKREEEEEERREEERLSSEDVRGEGFAPRDSARNSIVGLLWSRNDS